MPAGHAWDAGVRPGMILLKVQGEAVPDVDIEDLSSSAIKQVELERPSGEVLYVEVKDRAITQDLIKFSLWLLGGQFAVLGSVVLLRRPDLSSARWFGAFAGFGAVALAVAPAAGGPSPIWSLVVMFVSLVGVGVSCLPFVATLAVQQYEPRRSLLLRLHLLFALAILIGYAVSVVSSPSTYEIVRPVFHSYVAVSLISAMVVLTLYSVGGRSEVQHQQSRFALFGIGLGTLPFIGLTLVPEIVSSRSLVPSHISVLAVGLIPAAFAYAILQHNLLGIRRLVHRGMVCGVATLATLVVILLGLTGAESILGDVWVADQSLMLNALLLTAGVALFLPARRGGRWLVDTLFYGDVTPYEEFVDSVQRGEVAADPADEIITAIASRLVDALHLESAVLFLGTGPSNARLLTAVGPRAEEVVSRIYPRVVPQIQSAGQKDLLDLRWESDSLLVMALRPPGRQIGFAIMGPKHGDEVFVEEEKRLALTVAPLLALAVDQSILSRELRDLNQRLVKAQEQERKRMAIDIHDGPLQKAIVLTRASEVAFQDPETLARELVGELREVCTQLRPSILDDLGIVSSLEWLLDGVSNRSEISASLTLDGVDEDERLDPDSELTLFRVTQEAINNTLKHADATRIDVTLSIDGDSLVLEASDDGTGFALSPHLDGGFGEGGIGLSGMRERVIYLDGSLKIRSAPGRGTTVQARIPRMPVADPSEART